MVCNKTGCDNPTLNASNYCYLHCGLRIKDEGLDENPLDRTDPEKWIYFVKHEGGNAVKIGMADDLGKRMSSLQTGSPDKLQLLAAVHARRSLEKKLHDYLREDNIRGEWFSPSDELLKIISIAETGDGDLVELRIIDRKKYYKKY